MRVYVSGSFDGLDSGRVRFLQEAARAGEVRAVLWPDAAVERVEGRPPRFPLEERRYLLEAVRFVGRVLGWPAGGGEGFGPDILPALGEEGPALWVVPPGEDNPRRRAFAASRGLGFRALRAAQLRGFPAQEPPAAGRTDGSAAPRRVLVTGCFDWLHSGHIRFFEEAAALGDLYVVVGHDANIRLLKGEGHPLFPAEQRRWLVAAVRHVHRALVSSGRGWMDAEPEVELIRPDLYVVNRDGDRPEKRRFCAERGIEYVVLERTPRPGLPARTSTDLRGF